MDEVVNAGWMAQLGFVLQQHDGGEWRLVDHAGSEREATQTEVVLWDALIASNAQFAMSTG